MSNRKRGLEENLSDLFTKILSSIVRGKLLDLCMYWMREKSVVFYSQGGFTPCPRLWCFNSQIRVYTMNVWKLFYFYAMRQSKVWTRITNRTDCHFVRCFIPKWGFTPWTEQIVPRFRIEESCLEFEETEWIIMQNMELGAFSSSRYSSWSDRYFLLEYEHKDK